VYAALRRIIDPDFGADIVECGFVKELRCDAAAGDVSFVLELTTPVRQRAAAARMPAARVLRVAWQRRGCQRCCAVRALRRGKRCSRALSACVRPQACPVKDEFERQARDYVGALPWVKQARIRSALFCTHARTLSVARP
jgi:metal-sulfur cluster biosynthetic enzyme